MKFSILTYVFDDYELLREPLSVENNVEYVAITDNRDLKSDVWNIIVDDKLSSMSPFDKTFYVRYHPFEYVHSNVVFIIDGSMLVKGDFTEIYERFEAEQSEIGVMINDEYETVINYMQGWVDLNHYDLEKANNHLNTIKNMGYNMDYKGVFFTGFRILRNCKAANDLNRYVYALLKMVSSTEVIERFDEPYYTFAINMFFTDAKLFPYSNNMIMDSKYCRLYPHKRDDNFYIKNYLIEEFYYLNNKIKLQDLFI